MHNLYLFKFRIVQNRINICFALKSDGPYRLCEQRRFRRACASAQSRQNLRCSLIQAVSQAEPSDRKPGPWLVWMAGHAQLKFVTTESYLYICRNDPKFSDRYAWANSADPDQTAPRGSLIRVYTVCRSVCIVWTHYSMVEPHSSNFRVITTNFVSVRIFRNFTVTP